MGNWAGELKGNSEWDRDGAGSASGSGAFALVVAFYG